MTTAHPVPSVTRQPVRRTPAERTRAHRGRYASAHRAVGSVRSPGAEPGRSDLRRTGCHHTRCGRTRGPRQLEVTGASGTRPGIYAHAYISVAFAGAHPDDPPPHGAAGRGDRRADVPRRRPVTGLRAGIRTDAAWRSWRLIAADWEQRLRGRRRRRRSTTVETHGQVGDTGAADRSHIGELADAVDFAIVGLGTCGSCTSFAIADAVAIEQRERPVIAVVTDEFATHGHNMAKPPRSR